MNTPNPDQIPGQTPITDPLQLQFLTGGQMGYMPQAQFMTPSEFGTFRTMPTPDVNGYAPQQQGFLASYLTAHRGGPLGLPAYTFNTYNPAVSFSLQQAYAARRVEDVWGSLPGMAANLGLGVALPMAMGLLPGLAAGMIMPDFTKPIVDRIAETRNIQNMTTAKIFSGPDRDRGLGMGFGYKAARGLDKEIRLAAADDTILKEDDYRELLKLGIEYGQFDYANNVEQYKRILKNLRGTLTTMMEVVGSTDFKDLMRDMKRMQDMGASIRDYGTIARREQTYARITGLTQQQAVDTYGKSGALIFQQSGLNAMQGSLQAMANAANMTYLQRTGVLDPVMLARHGGISGLTQRMTQQDATVQNSFKDFILPALMNDTMTGLKSNLDFAAIMRDPNAIYKLLQGSNRIYTPEQMLAYQAHSHKAYTELTNAYGPDIVEVLLAQKFGEIGGAKGQMAAVAGLRLAGMDSELAWLKTQGVYSKEAQSARERTMEEARQKRREEIEQRNNPIRRLERFFRTIATSVGEGVYSISRRISKYNEARAEDAAGRMAHAALPQSDFSRRRRQVPLSDIDPEAAAELWRKSELTDVEGENLLNELAPVVISETDKRGLQAMAVATPSGYGALQMIPEHFGDFFGGKGKEYSAAFNKHLREGDVKLLASLRRKYDDGSPGAATDAELAAYERAKAGWSEVSNMSGFTGAYSTYLRDMGMRTFDAAAKEDTRVALLKEDSALMAGVFGMANQFSPESFRKITQRAFGKMTVEDIRADIEATGGEVVLAALFDAADIQFQENKPNLKGNRRYRVGGREYRNARQNIRNKRAARNAPSRALARVASEIRRDPQFGRYSQETMERTDGKGGYYRPDCSGMLHEYIKRYVENNGGSFISEELNRKYTSDEKDYLDTAAGIFDDIVEAGGGEAVYDTWEVGKAPGAADATIAQFEANLREGMIIGVDYNKELNANRKRGIDHTGILVKGSGGGLMVFHQGSKGATYTSIADFIKNQRSQVKTADGRAAGATFYVTDLLASIKPAEKKPLGLSETELRERAKASLVAGFAESNKLLDTLTQGGTFSTESDATYADMQRLVNMRRMAKEGTADPYSILNVGLRELMEASGYKGAFKVLDRADIDAIYNASKDEVKTATDFVVRNGTHWGQGKLVGSSDGKGVVRMIVNALEQAGMSRKEARKAAAKAVGNYAQGKGAARGLFAVMQGFGVVGMRDVLANETDGRSEKILKDINTMEQVGTKAFNEYVRKNWQNSFKLNAQTGGVASDDLLDAYRKVIQDTRELEGAELGVGHIFEPVMYGAQLANEYSALMDAKYGKKDALLRHEKKDNIDKELAATTDQLVTWGKSIGLDERRVRDLLRKSGGAGAAKLLEAMYAERGVAVDDNQKKLIGEAVKATDLGLYADTANALGGYLSHLGNQRKLRSSSRDFGALNSDTQLRRLANLADFTNLAIVAQNYGLDQNTLENIHDRNVVSDSLFDAVIQSMQGMGHGDAVKALREARSAGRRVAPEDMLKLLPARPIGQGADSPMSHSPVSDEYAVQQMKLAQIIHSGGGSGGMLSPATDKALGELPDVLNKLNTTLSGIQGVLEGKTRSQTPQAPGMGQ